MEYNREWIIENAMELLENYSTVTVRQLHYLLVSRGMTNDMKHYKKVVAAMTAARWDGKVSMGAFVDRERYVVGSTEYEEKDVDDEISRAKSQIKAWMRAYYLNRWSNQPKYVEVWVEKKTLEGTFEGPCRHNDVALAPCKGYPSLTFLNEARRRFQDAEEAGKDIILLYYGDYDPSGEDIPRSIKDNLARMGCYVTVKRMALTPEQIEEMHLPGVPPKVTDSRTTNWDGDSVVELDAVDPDRLGRMCEEAIEDEFDEELHEELEKRQEEEKKQYQEELKTFIAELAEEGEE